MTKRLTTVPRCGRKEQVMGHQIDNLRLSRANATRWEGMQPTPADLLLDEIEQLDRELAEARAIIDKLKTANMFWDWDDSENCIEDLEEWLFDMSVDRNTSYIHRLGCARCLSDRFISVDGHDDDGNPILCEHTLEQWQAQRAAERAANK